VTLKEVGEGWSFDCEGRRVSIVCQGWSTWFEGSYHIWSSSKTPAREDGSQRIAAMKERLLYGLKIIGWEVYFPWYPFHKIRAFEFRSCRPFLCLPSTPKHHAGWLKWCNGRANWGHEGNSFSDESQFCLWAYDQRRSVK
jgi:hypothetical protein